MPNTTPTPAPAPAVASTVGLKNMVLAPLLTDTEAGTTYGELQKVAGAIEATITPQNADPDIQYFDEFCEKFLNTIPGIQSGYLELHGESLLLVPSELPSLAGLRVMRGGFYLGDLKTKRFEPSQALAMGLPASDAKLTIDFPLESEWLERYLKGESFEWDADDGWNLVCTEGYPLGWAKAKDGRLKNKYPKGWVTN